MHKISTIVFTILCLNSAIFSQVNTEAVKVNTALMDYIEGFYEGDSAKIIRSISPSVLKYGYWKAENTIAYVGEPISYQEMIDYAIKVGKKAEKAKVGTLEKVEVFEVQDQTASGKVTAWWGTDYLLLAKINDRWIITHVLWQSYPNDN